MKIRIFFTRCVLFVKVVLGLAVSVKAGVNGVTGGTYDLRTPVNHPPADTWYYNSGIAIQLDSTTAGLLADIRRNGTPWYDYEAGIDLVMFDSMSGLNGATAIPISRPTLETNPETGQESLTSVYPMYGGFVPRGAAVAGDQLHSHAGTGFGMKMVGFYPAVSGDDWPSFRPGDCVFRLELQQFTYDGNQFTAGDPVRMSADGLRVGETDWYIDMPGFSPAIPDGEDLLFPVLCTNGDNGVARFEHGVDGWQPVSFVPVTSDGSEASLIRDVDGSLLFSRRNGTSYQLWRSTDGGDSWNLQFDAGERLATPVILSRAADGTPYFSGNPADTGQPARNTLEITPVNLDRDGLCEPLTILDGYAAYGASPDSGDPDSNPDGWYIDHGYGNTVRLADGQWHGVFVHRVLAQAEQDGEPATPYTGLYMEEVFSTGPQVPLWTFVAPEPASLSLLAVGGPALLRRKRR
ncbi:MAG: exo-alpha-sialidase [Phycisphaerae bacterium]|nr:exo-alpha-sialidase [Phycisphaerae bacterium]